jgi:hypothetical protein
VFTNGPPSSFNWTGDHNITHTFLKVHFNIILMSTIIYLCFGSSDKILEFFRFSLTRTICPEHLMRLRLVSIITFCEECTLQSTSLCSCLHPPVTSYLWRGEVRKYSATIRLSMETLKWCGAEFCVVNLPKRMIRSVSGDAFIGDLLPRHIIHFICFGIF